MAYRPLPPPPHTRARARTFTSTYCSREHEHTTNARMHECTNAQRCRMCFHRRTTICACRGRSPFAVRQSCFHFCLCEGQRTRVRVVGPPALGVARRISRDRSGRQPITGQGRGQRVMVKTKQATRKESTAYVYYGGSAAPGRRRALTSRRRGRALLHGGVELVDLAHELAGVVGRVVLHDLRGSSPGSV